MTLPPLETSKTHNILAANMWLVWNMDNAKKRYDVFNQTGRSAFKSFIDQLMSYDADYIPTQDFLSLTFILGVLGESALQQLLNHNLIRFIRLKGSLCYVGNGGGIQVMGISEDKEFTRHLPFSANLEDSVKWSLGLLPNQISDRNFYKKVLDNTTEIDLRNYIKTLKDETYNDISKNQELQEFFALRNRDFDKLQGIEPNQVRIYGGKDVETWTGDEIDTTLLLSNTNLELKIAELSDCTDMTTSNPIGHLLKAKFKRQIQQPNDLTRLTMLQEIAGIPDIGEGILNNVVAIRELMKLKYSRNGQLFYEWFHSHCGDDPVSIAREFHKVYNKIPSISSLPTRIIRFIVSNGIGFIPIVGGFIGTGVSLIDTFFLDKWGRGYSPKFFIEDLRQILTKK